MVKSKSESKKHQFKLNNISSFVIETTEFYLSFISLTTQIAFTMFFLSSIALAFSSASVHNQGLFHNYFTNSIYAIYAFVHPIVAIWSIPSLKKQIQGRRKSVFPRQNMEQDARLNHLNDAWTLHFEKTRS